MKIINGKFSVVLFVVFALQFGAALSSNGDSVFGKIGTVQYPCPNVGYRRLPHTNSCDKYVQCLGTNAYVVNCGSGLHFSTHDDQCMSPELAGCNIDRMPCPQYNDHKNPVYLTSNKNCNLYYLCYNSVPVPFTCAQDLLFDPFHWQCRKPDETICDVRYHLNYKFLFNNSKLFHLE